MAAIDCFCFLVNTDIFDLCQVFKKKIHQHCHTYVSNLQRTVSRASKPSAFVGTSFRTGSSSLSEFSPSESLFNREFIYNIIIKPRFSYNYIVTARFSSNVTPISPRVLRIHTRRDKGSSSLSLPDSLSSIFVSSFLNPSF